LRQEVLTRVVGVDEGLISGTLQKQTFRDMLGLDDLTPTQYANTKGNMSAMVQLGSVVGAAL